MGYHDIVIVTTFGSGESLGINGGAFGMTANHVLINDSVPGCDRPVTWETGASTVRISAQSDANGGTGAKIPSGTAFIFGIPD